MNDNVDQMYTRIEAQRAEIKMLKTQVKALTLMLEEDDRIDHLMEIKSLKNQVKSLTATIQMLEENHARQQRLAARDVEAGLRLEAQQWKARAEALQQKLAALTESV